MTADILILLKEAVGERDAGIICRAIYKATRTAVVNFDPKRGKILFVKFDPDTDVSAEILKAVRETGRDAVMAGG